MGQNPRKLNNIRWYEVITVELRLELKILICNSTCYKPCMLAVEYQGIPGQGGREEAGRAIPVTGLENTSSLGLWMIPKEAFIALFGF